MPIALTENRAVVTPRPAPLDFISTGIRGLDDVLSGGLTPERLYLVEGTPGTGKTTLGLGFALEGAARGESALYVTLAETEVELLSVAQSHGWRLDGIEIAEMVPADSFGADQEQTLLHPSEVELGETLRLVMAKIDEVRPSRVVIDSLSELRLLAQSPVRYRRQILALKHFFSTRQCTVLLLDDQSASDGDMQLHSICHGVIALEQTLSGFGAQRRRLHVVKMRGVRFRGGYHDFEIEQGGLCVYPRLVAAEHAADYDDTLRPTGSDGLDALLGGGLAPGTAALLSGPAGVGKTTACVQAVVAALKRGEKVAYFLFDERQPTLVKRSAALGMDILPFIGTGQLILRAIDPAELSPGEFTGAVRAAVEDEGVSFVVIDSLNAYLQAMPGEQFLILQMHEMLTYLGQKGVTSLLILGMHGVMGDVRADVDLSYLADTVLHLRYFEAAGEVRQAISVIKTRTSRHERTIREFRIDEHGLQVGEPLSGFQGVLSGVPTFTGKTDTLMASPSDVASPVLSSVST
jgi:circadian clock protein KaiC